MEKTGNNKGSDEFLNLFLANQKQLKAFILYNVPNRADADDIFQNTTSVLWKKFDQFEAGTDFLAWSITVARFEIKSCIRKKKREGKIHFDEDLQQIIDSEAKNVSSQLDERLDALRKCLEKLASSDVNILKMRHENELSFDRIAARLGVSSAAAFKKISKIQSLLIQCIRQRIAFGE